MTSVVSPTASAPTVNETPLRQILRHGSVFGIAAVVFRLASVVLLPVYTRVLSPADYGILAIVDLTSNLLAIVAGSGIAAAAIRAHSATDGSPRQYAQVWWTALVVVTCTATLTFGPALIFRKGLTRVVFAADTDRLSLLLALGLVTTWVASIAFVTDMYFRSRKESWFVVKLSLFRLALNIFLNVTFLVWFGWGVAGVVYGNLIAGVVGLAVQGYVFVRRHPSLVFSRVYAKEYLRFGWPMAVGGLLSVVLHDADRFLLRGFSTLGQVGLYSVGYNIAQGVNTLCMVPFTAVWNVLLYEVGTHQHANRTYGQIFRYASLSIAWVLFTTSVCARPLLRLLASPEYAPAADVVPVVCLAYWFFSLHEHFKAPALLEGRTISTVPIYALAAVVNVLLNLIAIPRLGAIGAAWVSVVTFAVFSFGGLFVYRRIRRFDYPLVRCLLVVAAMAATLIVARMVPDDATTTQVAVGAVSSLAWLAMLFSSEIVEAVHKIAGARKNLFSRPSSIITNASEVEARDNLV